MPTQNPARSYSPSPYIPGISAVLASDERGTGKRASPSDTRHDAFGDAYVEPAGGEIVKEEQRFRAEGDDIVHAHRNQVDSDGVVSILRNCKHDLRAYPVGAGHQHGVTEAAEGRIEQRAETPWPRDDAGARGVVRNGADALDQVVAPGDIDAGVAVTEGVAKRSVHGVYDGTGIAARRGRVRAAFARPGAFPLVRRETPSTRSPARTGEESRRGPRMAPSSGARAALLFQATRGSFRPVSAWLLTRGLTCRRPIQ